MDSPIGQKGRTLVRRPAVAGSFYPAKPSELETELKRCLAAAPRATSRKAIGIVAPHAGYKYSGAVAGLLYGQLDLPEKFIILSPNHTGHGSHFSIMPRGWWELPVDAVPIDEALSESLMKNCPQLEEDTLAHTGEHSLEVQLPFLQHLKKNKFSFVPVTLGHVSWGDCQKIGEAVAKTLKGSKEPVLIIASSDMNHYENQQTTMKKDQMAIDKILALDPQGLFETVVKNRISMCGIIPTTVMLVAANALGASRAELLKHTTSGEITGDYNAVVGYASLIVS